MDSNPEILCPGCFSTPAGPTPCPRCGYDPNAPRPMTALPSGLDLHGQFTIGRVLGRPGGFGITYLAFDRHLEATVAIKEFLPRDLAARAPDGSTIVPHGSEDTELFRYGLTQFLTEARTLARLNHPNIVRIRQFFEANQSAYLVMDYYPGRTLAEYLDSRADGRLPERIALALMHPILDGLRAVHAKGFLHRDVKPQNIYLSRTDSGGTNPVLIDFGAAREALGARSQSMSVMVSAGYAPLEQYSRKGQGTFTDVYAAGAVLYHMLTGLTPPPASERILEDELEPAAAFGISAPVSDAITRAMAMRPGDRPDTIEAFQSLLYSDPRAPEPAFTGGVQATEPRGAPSTDSDTSHGSAMPQAQPHEPEGRIDAAGGQPSRFRDPPRSIEATGRAQTGARLVRKHYFAPDQYEPVYEEYLTSVVVTPPELVVIPAGSFLMGSPPGEVGRRPHEPPSHKAAVRRAFALARTPVTFEEYDAFCRATGRPPADDQGWGRGARPVINVSWADARRFVEWLAEVTGKPYRLPTEVEWEYAARAGTSTPFSTGSCISPELANYDCREPYLDCRTERTRFIGKTAVVASYPANPWGLYDMHGNVWEWTQNCWDPEPEGRGGQTTPGGQQDCRERVVRGGAWYTNASFLRSASREGVGADGRSYGIGFRVALSMTRSAPP